MKYSVRYCRSELGWVVYENDNQISPGFSCESAADVWLDGYKKLQERLIEDIILGLG